MLRWLFFFLEPSQRRLTASGQSAAFSSAQTDAALTPPPVYGISEPTSSAMALPPTMTLKPSGLSRASSQASGVPSLTLAGAGLSWAQSGALSGFPVLLPGAWSWSSSVASAGAGVLSLRPIGLAVTRSFGVVSPDLDFEGDIEAAGLTNGQSFAVAMNPVLAGVFIVYAMEPDGSTGVVVAVVDGSAGNGSFGVDLSGLLPAGRWTLGVRKVDQYGTPGELALVQLQVGAGGEAVTEFVTPQRIRVSAWADGMIGLNWQAALSGIPGTREGDIAQRPAVVWEIADASNPSVVLLTVAGGSRRLLSALLGPFTDGQSVRLQVRASDGVEDGQRGPWALASAVRADDEAPAVPVGWDCAI